MPVITRIDNTLAQALGPDRLRGYFIFDNHMYFTTSENVILDHSGFCQCTQHIGYSYVDHKSMKLPEDLVIVCKILRALEACDLDLVDSLNVILGK